MTWQDYILTIGALLFAIALIPSLRSKDKTAFQTSLLTGTILVVFALTYFTLKLWFATLSTSITGLCWLVLAWQKYSQKDSS